MHSTKFSSCVWKSSLSRQNRENWKQQADKKCMGVSWCRKTIDRTLNAKKLSICLAVSMVWKRKLSELWHQYRCRVTKQTQTKECQNQYRVAKWFIRKLVSLNNRFSPEDGCSYKCKFCYQQPSLPVVAILVVHPGSVGYSGWMCQETFNTAFIASTNKCICNAVWRPTESTDNASTKFVYSKSGNLNYY